MASAGAPSFQETPLNTLDAPTVLLTCKPGVMAQPVDLEAGLPEQVVVQEDVVATGRPRAEEHAGDVEPVGAMEAAEQ
jgi:hypothetical protein